MLMVQHKLLLGSEKLSQMRLEEVIDSGMVGSMTQKLMLASASNAIL
jgi:hypothetical protein